MDAGDAAELRTTTIVWAALAVGPLLFLVVAHFVRVTQAEAGVEPTDVARTVGFIAAALAVVLPPLGRLVAGRAVAARLPASKPGDVHGLLRQGVIVQSAFSEGAALYLGVAYIIGAPAWTLLALVVPYVVLAQARPTVEQIKDLRLRIEMKAS
jgi:hypothetical protein